MGSFSITHWLIFLAIVVLIFGTAKFKSAGKDIGSAVKGFKDAMKDGDKTPPPASLDTPETIDGQATRTDHKHKV